MNEQALHKSPRRQTALALLCISCLLVSNCRGERGSDAGEARTGDIEAPNDAASDSSAEDGSAQDVDALGGDAPEAGDDPVPETDGLDSGADATESDLPADAGDEPDESDVADVGPPDEGFVSITAGTFTMGSPEEEPGREDDEVEHEVTLTYGFWMSETETTQGEWQAQMGNNPSTFEACGSNCPVEGVSWWDAVSYANTLSRSESLAECYGLINCTGTPGVDLTCGRMEVLAPGGRPFLCEGYRLPTEAEWEYAVRAGTTTLWYCGSDASCVDDIAWYDRNTDGGSPTHPVAGKAPNDWGLYDMSGNVWEWTGDDFDDYATESATDPFVVRTYPVVRGGGWVGDATSVRSAARHFISSRTQGKSDVGFRVVRSIPDSTSGWCEPGTTSCAGDVRLVCMDDYRTRGETDCSSTEERCVDRLGVATCEPSVCDPIAQARVVGTSDWGTLLEAIPLSTLELNGCSPTDSGEVSTYRWEVTASPNGSVAALEPNTSAQNTSFFLGLVGQYRFSLQVYDDTGAAGFEAAEVVVNVVPAGDLYVQLNWTTEGDTNNSDTGAGTGSDVNLHLVHPLGEWDAAPFDCYWVNPNPNWGSFTSAADDPHLQIEDGDGWGPEAIALDQPEGTDDEPVCYSVGVHYYSDHGFGASDVTVRIFLEGSEEFSATFPGLADRNAWEVARVCWPTGAVEFINQFHSSGFP